MALRKKVFQITFNMGIIPVGQKKISATPITTFVIANSYAEAEVYALKDYMNLPGFKLIKAEYMGDEISLSEWTFTN